MHVAKIFRHRHKRHHYINDDLKEVIEETHFKIIFSDPKEMRTFRDWVRTHDGEYDYDKENSCQRGKLPEVPGFTMQHCWCDIQTFYLLHVAGYEFYESISPYKCEIYIKHTNGERKGKAKA